MIDLTAAAEQDAWVQKTMGNFIRAMLLMPLYIFLFETEALASPTGLEKGGPTLDGSD